MIAGIFVGGASRRMGGRPKGRLLAPPESGTGGARMSIVERTVALAKEHCDRVVLVGRAEEYADLGLAAIADAGEMSGRGPLAGLVALLDHAEGGAVIAIACDMPYLEKAVLARLTRFAPAAAAVAPRTDGAWSPLFARYDAGRVAAVARANLDAGEGALWRVLDAVQAIDLPLSVAERAMLRDGDEPNDIPNHDEFSATRTE